MIAIIAGPTSVVPGHILYSTVDHASGCRHMKLLRTQSGWILETSDGRFRVPAAPVGALTTRDDLAASLRSASATLPPVEASALTHLLPPIEHQEVWAAGVTYFRSRTARMEESKVAAGSHFYDLVYTADRPELFFKAASWRVVGTGRPVRIRRDATWSVPEPELALLISPSGRILGYTAGNDMSSRDIEGENPLYLPQAKVYDGACALGPALVISEEPPPSSTQIHLEIRRRQQTAFAASTTLSAMKRELRTLVDYLYRETSFPNGCILLTGTGVVPPDDFTLERGDEILITVDNVGTLHNLVE
jgi:2-dehydro-3-deoxy-D-arabinonate dehydratase